MSHTYVCANCKGEFETTDEQDVRALREKDKLWNKTEQESGLVEVCDECFQKFMKWFKAHPEVRLQ